MNWKRIGGILGGVLLIGAGTFIGLYISFFVQRQPTPVAAAAIAPHEAALTLQTVAAVGHGPEADWVSYYSRTASGQWRHSTILRVPAHSLIRVTVYEYDTATGLRNPLWGEVRGVVGGTMSINGKPTPAIDPTLTAHTFTIPGLGVNVPLEGIAANASNQCSAAPCPLAAAHNTITFAFRTQGTGQYSWQCFVPCGLATILGFGGPMQTIGFMDGMLEVV